MSTPTTALAARAVTNGAAPRCEAVLSCANGHRQTCGERASWVHRGACRKCRQPMPVYYCSRCAGQLVAADRLAPGELQRLHRNEVHDA